MKQKQICIDWNAKPVAEATSAQDDDSSGDPMIDAVNELFAIQAFLEGNDFAQEYILKEMQKMVDRWTKYLQHRMAEELSEQAS